MISSVFFLLAFLSGKSAREQSDSERDGLLLDTAITEDEFYWGERGSLSSKLEAIWAIFKNDFCGEHELLDVLKGGSLASSPRTALRIK